MDSIDDNVDDFLQTNGVEVKHSNQLLKDATDTNNPMAGLFTMLNGLMANAAPTTGDSKITNESTENFGQVMQKLFGNLSKVENKDQVGSALISLGDNISKAIIDTRPKEENTESENLAVDNKIKNAISVFSKNLTEVVASSISDLDNVDSSNSSKNEISTTVPVKTPTKNNIGSVDDYKDIFSSFQSMLMTMMQQGNSVKSPENPTSTTNSTSAAAASPGGMNLGMILSMRDQMKKELLTELKAELNKQIKSEVAIEINKLRETLKAEVLLEVKAGLVKDESFKTEIPFLTKLKKIHGQEACLLLQVGDKVIEISNWEEFNQLVRRMQK